MKKKNEKIDNNKDNNTNENNQILLNPLKTNNYKINSIINMSNVQIEMDKHTPEKIMKINNREKVSNDHYQKETIILKYISNFIRKIIPQLKMRMIQIIIV